MTRARWGLLVLGLLISIPALTVGWLHDDIGHRLALEGGHGDVYVRAPHELYDFTSEGGALVEGLRAEGPLPWFTSPELSLRFFRPLSSLLLSFDHALFGLDPVLAHLHSLLWFLLSCLGAFAIFRRTLRPRAATLALAVYVVAGSHAMTTGWLAARHTLVGACFGMLAIWLHLGWRDSGDRWRGLLAPVALLIGMLSSESILAAVAYLVLYELVARSDGLRVRALAILPTLALAVAYLAFYVSQGFGARHSGTYIDPAADPVAFLGAVAARVPILLGEMYGAAPAVASIQPELRPALAAWGILTVLAVVGLLVSGRRRLGVEPEVGGAGTTEPRRLAWLGVSSALCLVPMVGGPIGGRLLPLAGLGAAALVGTAMLLSWQRAPQTSGARRFGLRAAVVVLVLLHFGIAPLVRLAVPLQLDAMAEAERRLAHELDLAACPDRALGYVLTGADPVITLASAYAIAFYQPEVADRFEHLRVLSMAPQPQRLELLETSDGEAADVAAFEVATVGRRRTSPFETVYTDRPPAAGTTLDLEELHITVLESSDEGLPTRVRFAVRGGLDRVCFGVWDGDRLVFQPPASGPVPHVPGPSGI